LVPRIIHQIWVGRDPLPKEFASYVKTWKQHHPEWEHRLWTEENLPTDLRRPEALERIRQPAERSDILRFDLLWRHGGVYVDIDLECRAPLDPHIGDADFVTAWLKKPVEGRPQRVNNAFMGSVPGHPLIDRGLNELRPQEWYGFDKHYSGALFFNKLVQDFIPDLLILPAQLIYPDSPAEEETAITVHHSARTWKDAEGFRESAIRAEKRLHKMKGELEKEQRAHAKTRGRLEKTEAKLEKLRKRRPEDIEAEGEKVEKASSVSKLLGRAR
jgi:hypothetical protein